MLLVGLMCQECEMSQGVIMFSSVYQPGESMRFPPVLEQAHPTLTGSCEPSYFGTLELSVMIPVFGVLCQ